MSAKPSSLDALHRLRHNPIAIASLLVLLLVLWLLSGDTFRASLQEPESSAPVVEDKPNRVETRVFTAERFQPEQLVQGQLEPDREVEVRGQTAGSLLERVVEEGDQVKGGDLLIRLDQEDRPAQLRRAEADLSLQEAELRAGESLFKRGLMSETEFMQLQAAVEAARAERDASSVQLDYTQVRAPFDGIVDQLVLEEGDYVQIGQSLAILVDVSVLKLTAYIPQQQVSPLRPGQPVEATLLDGSTLPGVLKFISSRADSSTRSFRVEARIDNPDHQRIAGASATMSIQLPERQAHRLSPALMVLNDRGQLSVKMVNADHRVELLPVDILSFDSGGIWVGGLPQEVELITLGGGFYSEGDQVTPVRAEQK